MTNARTLMAGLVTLALLAGCGEPMNQGKDAGKKAGNKKPHDDHPEVGPHGGAIAEWGDEEYHAEFTVDPKTKTVRVYVLGPDVKKPAPIKADKVTVKITEPVKFELGLEPDRQPKDPEGSASVFKGTHDNFAKEQKYKGVLTAKVGDKPPYTGDFDGTKK